MTAANVIAALSAPVAALVNQRVPKKLLLENGAPTADDKRLINDGIEELQWLAALKPDTIGVPVYRDEVREYLEIAVLSVSLRATAKAARLIELIHRAIPYPVFLIASRPDELALSLAHLRWSQGQAGQTVLDGSIIAVTLEATASPTNDLLAALNLAELPRQHLRAFYQGWIERFEAYAAARVTRRFTPATDATGAERRRVALAEHERLTAEIAALRALATKETQLNRRVALNLQLQQLNARLAEAADKL